MSDDAPETDPLDVEARLSALDSLPVDGHVAIYDALHRELRDQLAGGADAPGAPGGIDAPEGTDRPGPAAASHGSDAAGGSPSARS